MISLIKEILEKKKCEYLLVEKVSSSYELFFVKKELQMNRAKDVKHYNLTVFDSHNGFKGSSTIFVHPTMTKEDLEKHIDEALYAASLVNNPPFELAKPETLVNFKAVSNLEGCNKIETALKIAEAVFDVDTKKDGVLNATEIFIDEDTVRVMNSNGVDYSKSKTTAKIEYITTWKGKKEEVELYSFLQFGNLDLEALKEDIKEKLDQAYERSIALPMPALKGINVVFRPKEIEELMSYYTGQSNVMGQFTRQTKSDIGTNFQESLKGDALNITIDPFMASSVNSSPFDSNGFKNEKVEVIKDGKIVELWGNKQIAQLIGKSSRVFSDNIDVGTGTLDINELDEYLEIISMSGIQVDTVTGSYGGEIRLALYHKDGKTTPYYGGSINGFLKDVINDIRLGKEKVYENTYNGPKYILFKNQVISGK